MMVLDPVCKMQVDTKTAKPISAYHDQTYYSCAPRCKRAFDNDLKKYLGTDHRDTHVGHHH